MLVPFASFCVSVPNVGVEIMIPQVESLCKKKDFSRVIDQPYSLAYSMKCCLFRYGKLFDLDSFYICGTA